MFGLLCKPYNSSNQECTHNKEQNNWSPSLCTGIIHIVSTVVKYMWLHVASWKPTTSATFLKDFTCAFHGQMGKCRAANAITLWANWNCYGLNWPMSWISHNLCTVQWGYSAWQELAVLLPPNTEDQNGICDHAEPGCKHVCGQEKYQRWTALHHTLKNQRIEG